MHPVVRRMHTYRTTGMAHVHGWFDDESAEVIETLLADQLQRGVLGDVAEIGVHHGKSFLLLANGVRDDEHAVALDVFDDQDKNVDQSGLGDRAQLEANVSAWAPDADVVVLQRSSLEVGEADAASTFGRVRLMSIDGGHTAAITSHDLRLAEAAVVPDGLVVLDDLLNAHWLGVLTGLTDYLRGSGTLVPFAYSSNKLYLAPSDSVARGYRDRLRDALPDLLGKKGVEFLGGQVDVYGQGSPRRWQAAATARAAAASHADVVRELDEERRRHAQTAARRTALREEVRALRLDNRRLTRRLARRRDQVAAMQASASWRITRAPRRAAAVLRSAARRVR